MLPVSPKTFLMGSKSLLTSPKAIPNSVGDGLILEVQLKELLALQIFLETN